MSRDVIQNPPKTSEHFLSSNINILRDNYVVGGRINRGRGSGLPPKKSDALNISGRLRMRSINQNRLLLLSQ